VCNTYQKKQKLNRTGVERQVTCSREMWGVGRGGISTVVMPLCGSTRND